MTFTYRCDLPGSDQRSRDGQRISCIAPDTRTTFGPSTSADATAADQRADWARSWDAAVSNLREVVEALK